MAIKRFLKRHNATMQGINRHTALLLGFLLLGAGCSGSRGTTDDGNDGRTDPRDTINMADFEDFEEAPYNEEPPTPTITFEHDVPATLLEGTIEEQTTDNGQGYRIQIFSSQDKRAADRLIEDAVAWWRLQLRTSNLADIYPGDLSPPPIYLDFRQPYYRIRMGNFRTRDEAQAVLPLIGDRFPGAFVAPDQVTYIR